MRPSLLILFILMSVLSFSQKRDFKAFARHYITNDSIKTKLYTEDEDLGQYSFKIIDSAKKVVKTAKFQKPVHKHGIKHYTELDTFITDLEPGNYSIILYMGKEEMEKVSFSKSKLKRKNPNAPEGSTEKIKTYWSVPGIFLLYNS